VRLNDSNSTWLDYGRNDFERRDEFTYDLQLTSVRRIGDIRYLEIAKDGSDGWCLKRVELHVNNRPIFTHDFGTPCLWMDNDNGHRRSTRISGATLHNHALWRGYRQPGIVETARRGLPRDEIESRIEGLVGHLSTNSPVDWGRIYGRPVEASRKDSRTLHVDLDLMYDTVFDPEIDVDFDLRITCNAGAYSITVMNVKVDVDSPWYSEILGIGLVVDKVGNSMFDRAFRPFTQVINTGQTRCFPVEVQRDGDVVFPIAG
jgi:hypothetical protein